MISPFESIEGRIENFKGRTFLHKYKILARTLGMYLGENIVGVQ